MEENNLQKKSPAKFLFGLGVGASLGLIGGAIGAYQGYKKENNKKDSLESNKKTYNK